MRYKSLTTTLAILCIGGGLLLTGCDSTGPQGEEGGGNQAPSADVSVSPSQSVEVETQVTLDGSGSSDPNDDDLTYSWTLSSAPDGSSASLSDASTEQATFTPDVSGDYTATVTVMDGNGGEGSDNVTITAMQSKEPAVISSNISSDRTLDDRSSSSDTPDYIIQGDVKVNSGAKLTINEGVRIEFEADAGLHIHENASSISAVGTEVNPIVFTGVQEQTGFWNGLCLQSNNAQNEMTHVEVAYGGGSAYHYNDVGPGNIGLGSGARLTLTNATIRNSSSHGLDARSGADLSGFANNTFEGNKSAAVSIPFPVANALDANSSFSGNSDAPYALLNDTEFSGDVQLADLDVPYRISGDPKVIDGGTLTIAAGTKLEFESGAELHVHGNGSSISAVGMSDSTIVFTGVQEQAGFWNGIGIESSNTKNEMAHVEVAYGGGSAYHYNDVGPGNIGLGSGASLTLTNATIRNSSSHGLDARSGADLSGFANNTFEDNADAPVNVPFPVANALDANSSFSNNTEAYVLLNSREFSGDVQLADLDVPYRISGDPKVIDGGSLTINEGANLVFESGAGLHVHGNGSSISAVGTADNPIVFTGAQEQAGFWNGIGIQSSNANNEMTHVEVAYGGGGTYHYNAVGPGNIGLGNGGSLNLTNSSIHDSDAWGVHVTSGSTLNASGNSYNNNASGDVN